jgi:hypothetical protein
MGNRIRCPHIKMKTIEQKGEIFYFKTIENNNLKIEITNNDRSKDWLNKNRLLEYNYTFKTKPTEEEILKKIDTIILAKAL